MSNEPLVEVRDLEKVFRMGDVNVRALRGVSFDANPGEFLAILGPSGSGKSTLFHIIGGLTPASGGHVKIAGRDLAGMSEYERTQMRKTTVGFVFQKFNLLPTLTAKENILIARAIAGKPARFDDGFEKVIEVLGISHRLDHKPNALSGGEQQRVAIARAVVNHPPLLLADEPTGNLDSKNSMAVLDTLKQLNRDLNQTILMITHNAEAAEYCANRILHMRDGEIEEYKREEHA